MPAQTKYIYCLLNLIAKLLSLVESVSPDFGDVFKFLFILFQGSMYLCNIKLTIVSHIKIGWKILFLSGCVVLFYLIIFVLFFYQVGNHCSILLALHLLASNCVWLRYLSILFDWQWWYNSVLLCGPHIHFPASDRVCRHHSLQCIDIHLLPTCCHQTSCQSIHA